MQMLTVTIAVLVCLQLKHFVADYLLQPGWVLVGKGDMRKPGGYAHAGAHAIGSLPAYLVAGLGVVPILALMLAEFAVHYVIDYVKAGLSRRSHAGPTAARYWALHGADQLAHQLTYAAMTYAIMALTMTP